MDITIFDLNPLNGQRGTPCTDNIIFVIPTLSAYAIGHADVQLNGLGSHNEYEDFEINGNEFIWKYSGSTGVEDKLRLLIHYYGIRDYALLFPSIQNSELGKRLGQFYQEAESAFQNGAWLSYSLMCGAIYEGILFARLNQNENFKKLITKAENQNLISSDTARTMNTARILRNLVHGNKFTDPYVSRAQAMDMRSVMDKLIKQI